MRKSYPKSNKVKSITKVLFDGTVCSIATRQSNARTGVYRVADEVSRRLAEDPRLEMAWLATSTLDAATLREQAKIDHVAQFPVVELELKRPFISRVANKIRRRIANLARRRTVACHADPLLSRSSKLAVKPYDVFYSPFYDCHPHLFRSLGIQYVLGVNDLIPIKFPELLPPGAASVVQKAIDNLTSQDTVICISEATRKDLLDYRPQLDHARIRTIHLGASSLFRPCNDKSEILSLKSRLNIPDNCTYVLSVCTLEPRKNLRHVIECFGSVALSHTNLYLVLTGSNGWDEKDLFAGISSDIRSRIVLPGYLPDHDLPLLYSGAECFIYMSLYEGFGLPPLEAMQCGTPVITSNNSSLPEVVGDGGIMLPATDKAALIQAMHGLIMNPDLRGQFASKALARATKFSWDRCASETADLFVELAQSR